MWCRWARAPQQGQPPTARGRAAAARATEHARGAAPQVVQPYRWLTFAGFLKHLGDVPDEWRWRFMHHILGLREGFPQDTWNRVRRFANFNLHTGCGWEDARLADGRVMLATTQGAFAADFVIAGTGVDHDCRLRPELARGADNIATWADRYTPPAAEADDRLGRFPYLGGDYAFQEKVPGVTSWISRLHLFGIGATMSFGPSGSSINAMTTAVPRLVAGVTRGLFVEDVAEHWQDLLAYADPQAVLTMPD